ncbi:hypothetical protein EV702DRAFT_1190514 [Suillus placidus]|uniref:Uncharacterized protein n=1 Tax=Suillus placidus TaxID=48579 RepID=A0A9P7A6Q6_9AGAM|nr:hypothetical protein EV702DRAFT_1190514 [Suillus placidus]
MSFNTAALYGCPQTIPSPYQARYPYRPRASTMTQDANTQWHRDARRMTGLHATVNFQPPILSREYSSMWDDVEVQNDWAMAAREQESACQLQVERSPNYEQHARENKKHKRVSFDTERGRRASIDRKRARHESVDRERRGRVSLDQQQEHPAFIDYEREYRASVDRKGQRRESFDRERECRAFVDHERERRASIDRRHDRERDMSIGHHGRYGSVSRTFPRPPVCAVSFKPPTTGPRSRHRKSDSESVAFSRPAVCGVYSSLLPRVHNLAIRPTTGPQSRHPRRSSFDHATGHDYSGERQHPVYVLPPSAPAPRIHLPPRQRDRTASVEAVRRLPFLSPEVPPFEKSKPSGLTHFNPFNRLRSAAMSTSQKIRRKTAGRA